MNFRAFLFVAATFLASTLAFAQSSPLIMYHADNLDVSRKRGTLLLTGNVHFVHDSVAFRTQRASWNRNTETVECGGGFLFTHPSGFVRARNGSYQRKSEIAIASGEVSAGDSAGSYLMTGQYLKYDRKEDIVSIPMSPRLYQYEKQKNNPDICFLCIEKSRGIVFLTLSKGGRSDDPNALKRPLEIISLPIAGENDPSGQELIYMPAFISIIQDYTEAAMDSETAAYSGLKAIARGVPRGVKVYSAPDEARRVFSGQLPDSAVQILISPDGTTSSKPRHKLTFDTRDYCLYSYSKS